MIVTRMYGQIESRRSAEAATPLRPARKGRFAGAVALLALGLGVGCGAYRPVKYYDLTVPGGLAPATPQTLPLTIIVGLPAAPDLYRGNRLIYSVADQQLGAYEYDRWIASPPELIRDVFLRNLRASGRYAGVFTPQAAVGGDYSIRMRLYDFKEQDLTGSLVGRVSMDIELRNSKTGETVWQQYYTHDEPISAKTVPEVVAALNRNVQMAANNLASGMDQYFAAHPSK